MEDRRGTVLVTAGELAARLDGTSVIAVRIAGPKGLAAFAAAPRIPGAVDADMPTGFAAPGGGTRGSRPLPEIAELQRNARRWGLRAGRPVVVYDHDRGLTAARAWWVLRWAGLREVRLLDGGYAAWAAAGLPVSQEVPSPSPGDVALSPGHMPVLDADGAAALARDGLLLDTRIRPNYIRGHIPGSVSAPAADTLTEPGPFTDTETLVHLFRALGVDGARRVGVSCGAGVSAAHTVAALASIGVEAPMYPGSWSAWSADPARPVGVGGLPG